MSEGRPRSEQAARDDFAAAKTRYERTRKFLRLASPGRIGWRRIVAQRIGPLRLSKDASEVAESMASAAWTVGHSARYQAAKMAVLIARDELTAMRARYEKALDEMLPLTTEDVHGVVNSLPDTTRRRPCE